MTAAGSGDDDRFRGVCPVLEVPFTPAGDVDQAGFARVVDHVLGTGVTAVMFPGFASEFHKLDDAERDLLARILLERTSGLDVAAIVSVPDHATTIAVRRARSAVDAGADAVNILPPSFLSPPGNKVLAHVEAVLDAVAGTTAILQYAPAQTGTVLSPEAIRGLARAHQNLRLVKVEAVPPGPVVSALLDGEPSLSCLVGYAGVQLPDALRRGAAGVQPGCSFVELYVRVWDLWESGRVDEALGLHGRMLPYLAYWMQGVELIVQAEKTISQRRGLIDHDVCRAPGRPLDAHETAMVDRFLEEFHDLLPTPVGRTGTPDNK
ncbi:dihydrodipicolinate synthase family protein [Jiangella asiatica]|uniref:Dihydrodipicolinate synthase family protein n=1 Tax=Jiangella asiatica TaxID=2530372 RepID=A0A4R5D9U6_9ACTN|nr:dihydrodipicolinate synthase family protein [Jiangella asiatica]TDE10356.1 dihydrodipicolinate synthase family protein [Jiangella asiatica]